MAERESRSLNNPFIIYSLGRTRTAWLSEFLTFGDCICFHEPFIYLKKADDLQVMLNTKGWGFADSSAAPGYLLIQHYNPTIKTVVIRSTIDRVVNSYEKAYEKVGLFLNKDHLFRILKYEDRMLDKIEAGVPNILRLTEDDLDDPEALQSLFEYCTELPRNNRWLESIKDINVQAPLVEMVDYYLKNYDTVIGLKKDLKRKLIEITRQKWRQ